MYTQHHQDLIKYIFLQVTQCQIESSDEEDNSPPAEIPTHSQAAEMMEKCLIWYEHQKEAEGTSLLHQQRVQRLAAQKRTSNLK